MSGAKYREPSPITRSEVLRAIASGRADGIARALVDMAFHEPEREWAEQQCLRCLQFPEPEIQEAALVCIGHLARIHRSIDTTRVLPALEQASTVPRLRGQVEDVLDDIRLFVDRSD